MIAFLPRKHCAVTAALLLSLLSTSTLAAPRDDLADTKKAMEQSRLHKSQIAEQRRKLEDELQTLQKALVQSATTIQKNESELSSLEEKLRILDDQLKAKTNELAAHKKQLAALVQAALRLSGTPPEAAIMMPGDMSETMKAARALKMMSDSIKQETQSITTQLGELREIKRKAMLNRKAQGEKQAALDEQRRGLQKHQNERRSVQETLHRQEREEGQKLVQLGKKAENLQGLIASLEKAEKERQEKERQEKEKKLAAAKDVPADTTSPSGQHGKIRSFVSAKGHIRPPVAGKLVKNYGAAQGRNETSKGIAIMARAHAQVVAPYDGEVVYAGNFLNYGRMVIIRHSDDFHTLLTGLDKIDTATGEFLLEGEPIGVMGDAASENRLYVELRKNNQPTDPAPWISGLSKENISKRE